MLRALLTLLCVCVWCTEAYRSLKSSSKLTRLFVFKKSSSDSGKSITKPVERKFEKKENVDSLEKQLLAKYGANSYKEALLNNSYDDDDDEFERLPVKQRNNDKFSGFQGFNPPAKGSSSKDNTRENKRSLLGRLRESSATAKSKDIDNVVDTAGGSTVTAANDEETKDSNYEGFEEENESDASRSGPLNAINGYRLRPTTTKVLSTEEIKIKEKKDTAIAKQQEAVLQRKKENQLRDKNDYQPFDFAAPEQQQMLKEASLALFTTKSFEEIGITHPTIISNLVKMGIFHPTKIQEKSIPLLQASQNIVIQALTGSGKTLAFLLPLLDVIQPENKKVQCIIMAPSRELVTQIGLVGTSLFEGTGINIVSIIGGANVQGQIKRLRNDKPQIIVATPGRLAEIIFRLEKLRLGNVKSVIIDEIDNMLNEPYIGEIETILQATPLFKRRLNEAPSEATSDDEDDEDDEDDVEGAKESTSAAPRIDTLAAKGFVCLASATGSNPDVALFADKYLSSDWTRVTVDPTIMLPTTITHGLISSPRVKALELLRKFLLAKPTVKSALIFVNDPYRVELICEKLLEMGMIAAPLHGDTSKDDRKEILTRLRDGRVNLVVTTELAARGIDIPDLTHVINFELPTDAQHYIHRSGRCGRAGRAGLVMNFATPDTKFVIRRFGKQLKVKILDCEIREGQIFLKSR